MYKYNVLKKNNNKKKLDADQNNTISSVALIWNAAQIPATASTDGQIWWPLLGSVTTAVSSSAAAEPATMSEQESLRCSSARNRGGVQRVEGKLRASVEKGDYYEAHQMYRTLFFRWDLVSRLCVCVCSCGCHLAFWASLFPDHSTVNLASPLAVSNWIDFTVDLPTHVRLLVCLDRCGVNLWQPRNNFANFSC